MIRENEIVICVIRDLLFFLFVNCAKEPPGTTLVIVSGKGGACPLVSLSYRVMKRIHFVLSKTHVTVVNVTEPPLGGWGSHVFKLCMY